MPVDEIISEMLKNPLTDGLTLSGGEPLQQAGECVSLAMAAREKGLNIWVFTGYTFEELLFKAIAEPDVNRLLELTDVLVDGAFVLSERTLELRWRGSRNQRIIDIPKSLKAGKAINIDL